MRNRDAAMKTLWLLCATFVLVVSPGCAARQGAGPSRTSSEAVTEATANAGPPSSATIKPKTVMPSTLEEKRIAGEAHIWPDAATKQGMRLYDQKQVIAVFKLCVGTDGRVFSLNILKSSGYPEYDRKLRDNMRKWRYRPFVINGNATPVCTSQTFIYRR